MSDHTEYDAPLDVEHTFTELGNTLRIDWKVTRVEKYVALELKIYNILSCTKSNSENANSGTIGRDDRPAQETSRTLMFSLKI